MFFTSLGLRLDENAIPPFDTNQGFSITKRTVFLLSHLASSLSCCQVWLDSAELYCFSILLVDVEVSQALQHITLTCCFRRQCNNMLNQITAKKLFQRVPVLVCSSTQNVCLTHLPASYSHFFVQICLFMEYSQLP